jgi:hypothetical protein
MPYARMTHLGGSPAIARKHFWACSGFSLFYSALKSVEGQAFLKECKAAGKLVICWTANEIREFKDCFLCKSLAYISNLLISRLKGTWTLSLRTTRIALFNLETL